MRNQLSVFSSLSFGRQRETKLFCGLGNPLKKWGRYWGTTGRPWWKSLHFSGFWAQCADKTCIAISREGINNTTFFVLGYSKRETCWKKNYTHQQNIKKQHKTLWNFNQPWLLITLAAHINPCDFEDSIGFHDAKKNHQNRWLQNCWWFLKISEWENLQASRCAPQNNASSMLNVVTCLCLVAFQLTWGPDQKICIAAKVSLELQPPFYEIYTFAMHQPVKHATNKKKSVESIKLKLIKETLKPYSPDDSFFPTP